MKRVAQMEEMIKEANKLFKQSEGRDDFNESSFLMGVMDALTWARYNGHDIIVVSKDKELRVD